MADDGDKKHEDQTSHNPKRLTREEYDRLVQGVEDFYFGGKTKPTDVNPSSEENSADDKP
jgi:hypothetical protein